MRRTLFPILLLTLLTSASVRAEEPVQPEESSDAASLESDDETLGVEGEPPAEPAGDDRGLYGGPVGQVRFQVEGRSGFPVDAEGTRYDFDTFGTNILDVGGYIGFDDWFKARAVVRLFSGAAFGTPPCPTNNNDCEVGLADGAWERDHDIADVDDIGETIVPREAWVEFLTPIGLFRLGHMTSHWGLGVLAQDGADGPDAHSQLDVFNNRTHGDLVERLIFLTRPAMVASRKADDLAEMFFVALAGDIVYHDENADLLDGDLATQGILALGFRPVERERPRDQLMWELGSYNVIRHQEDDDGDELLVGVFDVLGKIAGGMPNSGDMVASLTVEAAFIYGETTRVATEEAPEEIAVNSYGIAAEAMLDIPVPDTVLGLRFGYASGDANSDDDTLYRFNFDPDFKAGLILFDHVLAEVTAASYDKAIDPERSAVPPKGVDLFPSRGSINSALFLNGIVVFEPLKDLNLAIGGLWARATVPLIDPTETFKNGGDPANPYGTQVNDKRSLGVEIDLMARYRYKIGEWLTLEARAEYGVFLFGEAFARTDGSRPDPIHLVSGRAGIYW